MAKRKNKRRIPNAQRSIESLNQEFGFSPDTQWIFERQYVTPEDRLRGTRKTYEISRAPAIIDVFPTVLETRTPYFPGDGERGMEALGQSPVTIRPVSPAPMPTSPTVRDWANQRYYPLKEKIHGNVFRQKTPPIGTLRNLEIPLTLGMFGDVVENVKADIPPGRRLPPYIRDPRIIEKNWLGQGVEQALYGQWLQKERMGRSDDDLARVRQALASQDVNALDRLLYDFQAWLTPDRSMWIDYMNQHARKMGIDLQPRAPSDPPRQPNPKKPKKDAATKKKKRRIPNAKLIPAQLNESLKLPEGTVWRRSHTEPHQPVEVGATEEIDVFPRLHWNRPDEILSGLFPYSLRRRSPFFPTEPLEVARVSSPYEVYRSGYFDRGPDVADAMLQILGTPELRTNVIDMLIRGEAGISDLSANQERDLEERVAAARDYVLRQIQADWERRERERYAAARAQMVQLLAQRGMDQKQIMDVMRGQMEDVLYRNNNPKGKKRRGKKK